MLSSPSVLTRPNLWSAIVQESMKVCAMTRSTASTLSDVCTSKTNWGFLMILIQNRKGRLQRGQKHDRVSAKAAAIVLKDTLHMLLYLTALPSQQNQLFTPCFAVLQLPSCSSSADKGGSRQISSASPPGPTGTPYLFVFQMWMVSGSAIP